MGLNSLYTSLKFSPVFPKTVGLGVNCRIVPDSGAPQTTHKSFTLYEFLGIDKPVVSAKGGGLREGLALKKTV